MLARSPAMREDDVEGLDEEFLHHLNRGADLLARREIEPARAALTRARELRPRDPKALGLLGHSLYKLGRFDDAIEVYGKLVEESPVEAAARVNLGLANLKARRYAQAVRQLEIALDLHPDHRKAMGYLGLAWFEQGHVARAREWFERAGSDSMVAKCDELLAHERGGADAPGAPPVEHPPAPAARPVPSAAAAAPPEPSGDAGQGLGALATSRLVALERDAMFSLGAGLLTVAVRGEVLAREDGLLAIHGAVRLTPEKKRFRGRATERPFGEGARRMLRAAGQGALLYRARGRRFTPVDLEGESAYVVENVVFAFDDQVSFENGRVASQFGEDLHLVHLSGRGQVLLATQGDIAALEVTRDGALRVPLAALVGWSGALTPRIVPLAEIAGARPEGPHAEPLVVELGGDGRALLDEGVAP